MLMEEVVLCCWIVSSEGVSCGFLLDDGGDSKREVLGPAGKAHVGVKHLGGRQQENAMVSFECVV
jgi:hypothetical protein